MQTERHTDTHTYRHTDIQTERHTEKDRQADGQTYRQTERGRERQRERQRQRERIVFVLQPVSPDDILSLYRRPFWKLNGEKEVESFTGWDELDANHYYSQVREAAKKFLVARGLRLFK